MSQQTFAYASLTACWRAYKLCGISISYSRFCQEIFNGGLMQRLDGNVNVAASIVICSDGKTQAQITIDRPQFSEC
jgi:hypothetical protein